MLKGSLFRLLILLVLFSCGGKELPEMVQQEYEKLPKDIDFNRHIKPILSDKCYLCHGPDNNTISAGLQLHLPELAYAELQNTPGKYAIKPGNLNKSELFHRILSDDPNYIMPTPDSHLSLSNYEKAALIKWIEKGAEYKDHWAFIKPQKYEIPEVEFRENLNNPIDNFVLKRLRKEGVTLAEKANKELLLRRLSFDLTGLPPTIEELDAFLNDNSPKAYEKQVNRLLNSPHYGEQMALGWMDLSRFADTHGYSVDRYRDMSPWRDWVIKSFNDNIPYNQFVTWQLAGDLLENATKEMKLATAFNRVHPNNMEGGIVNEEFLVEYAVDRVSTVGQAFMGLTVACARCHDHKYDPISQKNFYEMTSYFNNINESGQISLNNAMPVPTLLLTTDEEEKMISYLEQLIKDSESKIKNVEKADIDKNFDKWVSDKSYKTNLKSKSLNGLVSHFKLDNTQLRDALNPSIKGAMFGFGTKGKHLVNLADGKFGKGLQFDGDTWLHLKNTGVFGRNDSFSIGLWAKIPEDIKNGTIFHKGNGAILYNWRGYHLKIVDNKLELLMANTAPGNAIIETSIDDVPKNKWIHLAITYNGTSKASGFKLYLNGIELETKVKVDDLYKDILFRNGNEPALQLGARWRGKGIKGAIVDEIKVFNKALSPLELLKLSENPNLNELLSKDVESLTIADKKALQLFYLNTALQKTKPLQKELAKLKKTYVDSVEQIQEVMVMKEKKEPTQSYILERGIYDAYGEAVFPNVPEKLMPMPKDYPKNRLGFAKWLFHKDHPLTARVAVNRFWQHYFGNGLVKTSEDFGNQGEMPTHPELLDWLSLHFMESGWDVKALQKLIVMSNTYQQSSVVSKQLYEIDKENRLLARGPSKRLSGEMLRDNVLAGSGLLNKKIGGESVKPYQPDGLWRVNNASYKQDKGDKLYRRSMYTIWKRSVPHPTISTFDTPSRSVCTIRRQETNTPLQALVMLNDPTFIEASKVIGEKMLSYSNTKEAISWVFRQLTGRQIKPKEIAILVELQKEEYQKFQSNKSKIKGWINAGAYQIKKNKDLALIAANAVVASTIMNSDATITKR
ncbi:DUF1553 domain-containing protein [Sabulilitoribacter arenilitoris]|uniref:DUF1553 domain-containing protein n=1 Tax=Wocania arenilitoris TaxID=2044858 RepID=A0AAE3EP47_9FLAO|nr:DUF1553 domain-containing protein [Wocania arenilitoris]MCF7567644.1 DUF1553 domain-containing protein [Wocania arenilitoris]